MSYNNLVNSITNTNKQIPKIDSNTDTLTNILTRGEKMDAFLESKVVDKFKQKWKDLTPFLKTNRLKNYVYNCNEELSEIEKDSLLRKITTALTTGKLKNTDIVYDVEKGEIESIKGF